MGDLYDKWKESVITVYDSQEMSTLELLEDITNFTDDIAKGVDDLNEKIDIKLLGKTDINGDHKGTWQGLNRPTLSEEGMRSTVEKLDKDLDTVNSQLEQITNLIKPTNGLDDTVNIQSILNKKGNIHFADGDYYISDVGVDVQSNTKITFSKNAIIKQIPTSKGTFSMFRVWSKENIIIEGGSFIGDKENHLGTTGEWGMIFSIKASKNITIQNCNIQKAWGDGVYIGESIGETNIISENIKLLNNNISNNSRQGISVTFLKDSIIDGNICNYNNRTAPMSGIDLEPNGEQYCKNIKVINNICSNNDMGIITHKCENIIVANNTLVDNTTTGLRVNVETKDCVFSGNFIKNTSNGIHSNAGYKNKYINNTILNTTAYGIYIYKSIGNDFILDNIIENNNGDLSRTAIQIEPVNLTNASSENIKIKGNKILNAKYGILFSGVDGLIENNSIKNSNIGIYVYLPDSTFVINSNSIINFNTFGIRSFAKKTTIKENYFQGDSPNIRLDTCVLGIINNNTFVNGTTGNYVLYPNSDCTKINLINNIYSSSLTLISLNSNLVNSVGNIQIIN